MTGGDKAESNFDALVGKSPTVFGAIGRMLFDSKNGFASGAMIKEMMDPSAAQASLDRQDGPNPPTTFET